MKLNIEELARVAGGVQVDEVDPQCYIGNMAFNKIEIEAFARLIVECCAVEARKHIIHSGDADKAASAIRSLVVDK